MNSVRLGWVMRDRRCAGTAGEGNFFTRISQPIEIREVFSGTSPTRSKTHAKNAFKRKLSGPVLRVSRCQHKPITRSLYTLFPTQNNSRRLHSRTRQSTVRDLRPSKLPSFKSRHPPKQRRGNTTVESYWHTLIARLSTRTPWVYAQSRQ